MEPPPIVSTKPKPCCRATLKEAVVNTITIIQTVKTLSTPPLSLSSLLPSLPLPIPQSATDQD